MNISQVNFLQKWTADTLIVLHSKIKSHKCLQSDIPVTDFQPIPHLAELLVEVQVQTEAVLYFDALLDDDLFEVSFKAQFLKFPLKFFNPGTSANAGSELYA